MNPSRHLRGLALAGLALLVPHAAAQNRQPSGLPSPRLYQLSPAGGRAGGTVEVVVAGRNLEGAARLVFSRAGIKAEPAPAAKAEVDPKTKKPRPTPPLPADHFRFRVTLPADTPPGLCDVRLVNKWGVSNARAFEVGDQAEAAEVEPNNEDTQAQRVALNTTVNGTFAGPQDVDYFVFAAKKGQRVVVSCLASSIDSRANPAVEVYDRDDRQLASNNNYRDTDAVADFTAPADGDYLVRLTQFAHTFRQPFAGGLPPGAADHFYRLRITTAPWIDAAFPSVVEPGKATKVTVWGRNLPGGKPDPAAVGDDTPLESVTVDVTAPADGKGRLTFTGAAGAAAGFLDGFELRLKNAAGASNPFLIGLADAPVALDTGDNDTPEKAQPVSLPCEIAGRVERRRDRDWYSFTAKKGEALTVRVTSSRLGAPTYMTVLLRQDKGGDLHESPLGENMQEYSRKFFSRSEDPAPYRFVAPADGTYLLLVASRSGDTLFGPRHTYSVRLSRERPDFRLVALSAADYVPDAATVAAGGRGGFTVVAQRRGDFTGDVTLTVEGLPPGVTCPPQVLGAAVREATLVVSAAPTAADWDGEVRVKGTATINGEKVTREARTAGIVWPVQPGQNTPAVSRPEAGLWLAVRGKAPFALTPAPDKAQLAQGATSKVKVKVARLWPEAKGPIQVGLTASPNRPGADLPANLRFNNNQPLNVNPGQAEATFNVTAGPDVPPGDYNVVFRGQAQAPYAKDPKSKAKANVFVVELSAPLTVTVLPKSLATLTLSSGGPTVKVGGQADLVVRVQRKFGFAGPFTVRLALPAGVAGVEAGEVVIPENAGEARLTLKAPSGAKPGYRGNLAVRATALFGPNKVPVVHEAKFGVNVIK